MANLKAAKTALLKKQAEMDMIDDQLLDMDSSLPADAPASPEFDLLSQKREELEQEIQQMHEGIQLISEWEKLKGGPWSEDVKKMLGEIDIEISDIASGEEGGGAPMDLAPGAGGAPAPVDVPPAPEAPPMPEAPPEAAPEAAAPPDMGAEPPPMPGPGAAPLEPPMASARPQKSPVTQKNSYQSPDKKGVSARPGSKKEGSTMATPTQAQVSVRQKLAEIKSKREAIKREAQARVAAAWTIAKTMLPTAPPAVQKSAAQTLLKNDTKVLNAMLRQTAKNAHYSKFAENFKKVHKVELNDLLEDPSVLNAEKKAVESEIKGEARNASAKKADDRKDAGPQTETYNDGRGCGGGTHTEPKPMDAGTSASQTEAANRPENTVNKSEGEKKAAAAKTAKCECEGPCKCAAAKTAEKCTCEGPCKCGAAKEAAAKKADDMPPAAEVAPDAPPVDAAPPVEEGVEESLEEEAPEPPAEMPAEEPPAEDNAGEILSDEKKMVVEEKIEEAQEAIRALEQEILQEGEEELDLSQVFNEDGTSTEEMEEKVSALANEGDSVTAGNGEEFFAPSSPETMEASLDEPQMASMEDFFSLRGSDSDPLAHLIAGEVKTAEQVAGMDVIESFTEAAKHFESDTATGEGRDNENDHEGDLFAEAIEDQKPEDGGFKRVKQDETNELQAPKAAAKKAAAAKAPVIKKLKTVVASEARPMDIASALLGSDDF